MYEAVWLSETVGRLSMNQTLFIHGNCGISVLLRLSVRVHDCLYQFPVNYILTLIQLLFIFLVGVLYNSLAPSITASELLLQAVSVCMSVGLNPCCQIAILH